MSILSAHQRAVIRVDTGIHPLIIDRCVGAYDALVVEDVERYQLLMATAIAQMGFDRPITARDRPTAVDKIRTICQRAVADSWGVSFPRATARMQRTLDEYDER